jgi:Na+/H+-dicarboxylate symporter
MAKKVRAKPEPVEESRFEFPVFDERAFISHELELTYGMAFGIVLSVLAGLLSAWITLNVGSAIPVATPVVIGVGIMVATPLVFPRLRASAADYTKSDWAGVLALEFFAWLGLWLLIAGMMGPH